MTDERRSRTRTFSRRTHLKSCLGSIAVLSGSTVASGERRPVDAATNATDPATSSSDRPAETGDGRDARSGRTAVTNVDAPVAAPPDSFVEVDGSDFVVDGEPYFFDGTSNGRLTLPWSRRAIVDEIIEEAAAMGFNALRVWAFCNGNTKHGSRCFQPRPGEYGERAFERFDYLIQKAKRHGIRLIPALVNNWDPIGNMKQYVKWSDTAQSYDDARNGRGMIHDAFYTDEGARELFKDYVEHVLTRENSISGIEYRDDPTIMMWELANEPRAHNVGLEPLQNWIEDVSAFVKDVDPNHLVSTGSEGFYTDRGENWWYNGATGVDYVKNHEPSTIDACSFHCWPDHWDMSVAKSVDWIERHVREAHEELDKPAYMGEYGWPVDRTANRDRTEGQMERRNEVFETWFSTLRETNCDGSVLWTHRGHKYAGSERGSKPPLYLVDGSDADPYAIYHPEDENTVTLLERYVDERPVARRPDRS